MADKLRRFMHEKVGWTEEKTDQILLPVISEMKRRSSNVHQTNIQTFFPQTEYFKPSHGSKRVQEIIKDWHL
jgi:DNA excision repair protein ERCC-5